jgi:hypothetical protein
MKTAGNTVSEIVTVAQRLSEESASSTRSGGHNE